MVFGWHMHPPCTCDRASFLPDLKPPTIQPDACRGAPPPPALRTRRVACAPPTLQRLGPVLLDHDAELQDQLGRRLQEGLQQPQHVDVGVLEHHGPVPAALVLLLPPRHDAQVQGPDVPAGGGSND